MIKMFLKFLGKDRDPATLSQRAWDRFIRDRRSGRVGPSGKPVSDRTIERDLRFLLAVLNWAAKSRDEQGQILLESIRPLRLPTRHGHAPHRGLGGEPQACGAYLEAGGAEGAAAAAEARSAVAQRRIVHPAEAAVSGPRLIVRLRGLEDARRACAEAADSAGRSVRPARSARASALGQRARVHGETGAEMAGQAAGPDPLHRAGQSVGERLQRELQRQTERRVLERRDLLHTARGNGTRRAVEAAVQYRPDPIVPTADYPPPQRR